MITVGTSNVWSTCSTSVNAYIRSRYSRLLDKLTAEERIRRKTAIERFEKFLQKYPRNPKYTLDAQFRLAELYFERSTTNTPRLKSTRNCERSGRRQPKELPDEPKQNYQLSIQLFDRLITDWPKYRNIDGALYLKAIACQKWATLTAIRVHSTGRKISEKPVCR